MTAKEKLKSKINSGLHICVGLDTDLNKIPTHLVNSADPIFEFNKSIIDATKIHTCAYKINFAFYESYGIKGLNSLEKTVDYIPEEIFIIADAKRGDIGNTSAKYATSIFDHFGFDSITLHPYMGYDSVQPFLEYADKLNFILGLTSNNGLIDFEKQKLANGRFLYQEVISKVNEWNSKSNCGIVFGATNLDELKDNFPLIKSLPVLLPGVGAQGGSLEEVTKTFLTHKKDDFLINISRGIIYIDNSKSFQQIVEKKIIDQNNLIKNLSK
jgi:orotidine-5'-phosphate decarboxylase